MLVPLRFETELPTPDQAWPEITREDLDGMLWVSKVQANFCKLNSIPSPPYTIIQQPNVLNDVLTDLRHVLDVARQAASVRQRLKSMVSGTRLSKAVGRLSQPSLSGSTPADRKVLEKVTLLNSDFADAPSIKIIASDTPPVSENRLSLVDMPTDLQEEQNLAECQSLPIRKSRPSLSSNSPDGSQSSLRSYKKSDITKKATTSVPVSSVRPESIRQAVESAPLQPMASLQKSRRHKKTITGKNARGDMDKIHSGASGAKTIGNTQGVRVPELVLPAHSSRSARKQQTLPVPRERKRPAPVVTKTIDRAGSEPRTGGKQLTPASDLPDAEARTATRNSPKLLEVEAPDSPKRPPRASPRSARSPSPRDNSPYGQAKTGASSASDTTEPGRNFAQCKSHESTHSPKWPKASNFAQCGSLGSTPSPKSPKTKKKRGKAEYV